MKAKSEKFQIYLLKRVIDATFDEIAFKLDDKIRYTSTLSNAITKKKPQYISTFELVEKIKLISTAILKSNSIQFKGIFAPDMLNLVLFTCLNESTSLRDKRLLIDRAYEFVQIYDKDDDLKEYVKMGSWEKIAQC